MGYSGRLKNTQLITVNNDGVFLRAYDPASLRGRMEVTEEGELSGIAMLYNVDDAVPVTIKLIEKPCSKNCPPCP